MNLSISRSRENIWIWLFWSLSFNLIWWLGLSFIVSFAFGKTANDLAGPYLAFIIPTVIVFPLIWWLWRWEKQGLPPKRLARRWGLSMVLFCTSMVIATTYSGVKLGLMDTNYAVGGLVVSLLMGIPAVYFALYYRGLSVLSARTNRKQISKSDGVSPITLVDKH